MTTNNEPSRYYDWILWKMKQEDNMEKSKEDFENDVNAVSLAIKEQVRRDRLDAEGSYFERAIEVLEECASLMERKGQDYQGGSVQDDDYYPHGWRSFDTMLTTKVLRFRSVMEQQNDVNFDTAEDCLRDLINYAARCIVYLERNK